MEFNYIVVLFKNRTKQKILKKFKTLDRVNQYFKKLEKKSNGVVDIWFAVCHFGGY